MLRPTPIIWGSSEMSHTTNLGRNKLQLNPAKLFDSM